MDGNNSDAKYAGAEASGFDAIGARKSAYPENFKQTGNSVSWEIPRDTCDPPPSYTEVELSDMGARSLAEPLTLCIVKVRTLSGRSYGVSLSVCVGSAYSGITTLGPISDDHVLLWFRISSVLTLAVSIIIHHSAPLPTGCCTRVGATEACPASLPVQLKSRHIGFITQYNGIGFKCSQHCSPPVAGT